MSSSQISRWEQAFFILLHQQTRIHNRLLCVPTKILNHNHNWMQHSYSTPVSFCSFRFLQVEVLKLKRVINYMTMDVNSLACIWEGNAVSRKFQFYCYNAHTISWRYEKMKEKARSYSTSISAEWIEWCSGSGTRKGALLPAFPWYLVIELFAFTNGFRISSMTHPELKWELEQRKVEMYLKIRKCRILATLLKIVVKWIYPSHLD